MRLPVILPKTAAFFVISGLAVELLYEGRD
jgi:hypothetical protein